MIIALGLRDQLLDDRRVRGRELMPDPLDSRVRELAHEPEGSVPVARGRDGSVIQSLHEPG